MLPYDFNRATEFTNSGVRSPRPPVYWNHYGIYVEPFDKLIVPMLADEENSPMMAQIMARNLVDGTVHILKNRVRPSEVRAGLNQLITYHTQGMHALQ